MLDFLLSPTGMGILACGFIAVLAMYLLKRMRPRREVLYLRERDRRGQRLGITEETATSLLCKTKRGLDKRFFKYGGSYVFNEGGKMVTRFLAKEGTAYTYKPAQPGISPVNPDSMPESVTETIQCISCGEVFEQELPVVKVGGLIGEKLGSLKDALTDLWGKKFYNEIPPKQQKLLDESKILVTVELEPGLTPKGYSPVSEEEIDAEADREAAKVFGKGLGATVKAQLYQGMLWMALGVALTFILYNIGVFK